MRVAKQTAGDVELDLGRYELRRFGRRVKLEKRPMELLIFLVGRREQLVSRDDIVAKLWRSGLFIDTERNVNNIVFVQLCVTTPPNHVLWRLSSGRATASSARCG